MTEEPQFDDGHGTISFLVRDNSGESQCTSTNIVSDTVESEMSKVYDSQSPPLEESLEDCE